MVATMLIAPLLASLLLLAGPRLLPERAVPGFGLAAACVPLLFSVWFAIGFDYEHAASMQFVSEWSWIAALNIHLRFGVDGLSLAMCLLSTVLVACCLLYTMRVPPPGGRPHGFVGLVLLLEVGMLGTFLALDLMVFFLAFEVVLFPMWLVIASWGDPRDPERRRRAAGTFLLYTVLGSAVMLVGFLIIYTQTGSFDIPALIDARGDGISRTAQIAAALAIGLGLAVKSPMWPLHSWLPDAHALAPTVGSVLLAGVLLKMGSYGFLRVWLPIVPEGARLWAPYLAGFAAIGIVYGALACLAQTDLKRLVAYSSVGHMGFVLLGIATLAPVGANGAVFAGIAHGLITGLLFFLAGAVKDRYSTSMLDSLRGLNDAVPRLAGLLVFASVAGLGLPGLAGFWGEMLTLLGAYEPGAGLARPLYLVWMVVGGIGAVLTAWYLLSLLRTVCQSPEQPAGNATIPGRRDLTAIETLAWAPLIAGIVVLGVFPKPLLALTEPVVRGLIGGG